MASFAELQRQRKEGLREVRRRQRSMDTQIERLERRIFTLLNRKTLITEEDAIGLYNYYKRVVKEQRELEKGLIAWFNMMAERYELDPTV